MEVVIIASFLFGEMLCQVLGVAVILLRCQFKHISELQIHMHVQTGKNTHAHTHTQYKRQPYP